MTEIGKKVNSTSGSSKKQYLLEGTREGEEVRLAAGASEVLLLRSERGAVRQCCSH